MDAVLGSERCSILGTGQDLGPVAPAAGPPPHRCFPPNGRELKKVFCRTAGTHQGPGGLAQIGMKAQAHTLDLEQEKISCTDIRTNPNHRVTDCAELFLN